MQEDLVLNLHEDLFMSFFASFLGFAFDTALRWALLIY